MTSPGQNNQPDGQQRFVDALRHPAVVDLAQQLALPASYLEDVCDHVVPLLQAIERRITPNDGPVIIGLNGC
ncbi:MAG: hypothetical protein KJO55_09725, partial [Gammaproteobacteria bacterium]|nr:hypothetical protein [Gammaproteobacteria bacterium]